jgi:hypothetical protein
MTNAPNSSPPRRPLAGAVQLNGMVVPVAAPCVKPVGRPGADAVITGDMIHSPLQARYPELGMRVDYSSPQAGESRRKLFSCQCDTSTLICTAHFHWTERHEICDRQSRHNLRAAHGLS